MKKTIIIASDNTVNYSELTEILKCHYILKEIPYNSLNKDYIMQFKKIAALVIPYRTAEHNNYRILKLFNSDNLLVQIPVLIFCSDFNEIQYAEKCLEYGAAEILYPPFSEKLLIHKIKCSLKLQDSLTFTEIERILKELPSNIYLKDSEGKYIFATHYWHHLDHADDPDWTIRGKTDLDIRKDRENAKKAMEADLEIFKTGIGTVYTIEINVDDQREFMEIIKQPIKDKSGKITGIVGLINNVTDRELLRISLEERAFVDELTNVYNRRFFDNYIESLAQVGKYPISIISADCNDLKKVNDTYGHLIGDEYIRITALLFRQNAAIQRKGKIFRTGGDEFVIILTETDLKSAEKIVETLINEAVNFSTAQFNLSIAFGIACMENENDIFKDCLDAADKQMYAYKVEYKKKMQN